MMNAGIAAVADLSVAGETAFNARASKATS